MQLAKLLIQNKNRWLNLIEMKLLPVHKYNLILEVCIFANHSLWFCTANIFTQSSNHFSVTKFNALGLYYTLLRSGSEWPFDRHNFWRIPCNALSFYRSLNVLCWSKFFEPAQKFDCCQNSFGRSKMVLVKVLRWLRGNDIGTGSRTKFRLAETVV